MDMNIGYIIAVVVLALALAVETIYIFCSRARRSSSEEETRDEENQNKPSQRPIYQPGIKGKPSQRSNYQPGIKGTKEQEAEELIPVTEYDSSWRKTDNRVPKDEANRRIKDLEEENERLRKEKEDAVNSKEKAERDNRNHQEKLQRETDKVKSLQVELQKVRDENDDALKSKEKADRENRNLQEELQRKADKVKSLQVELQKERDEKDDALKRLSSIMSSRLRDGNPNVVDLSDQNRPLKVGEQFSELYDNQWTDAFSDIQGYLEDINEENMVMLLLNILKKCFDTCKATADGQLKDLNDKVKAICGSVTKKQNRLADDLMQRIKEERKMHAMENIPNYEKIADELQRDFSFQSVSKPDFVRHEPVAAYIKECLRLCFLMVNQDPPMAILTIPNRQQADNFKAYQNRGNHVKFVVWPALYLQEGGAMVSKGVAEFKN